jgi:hypothetical protein
LITPSVRVGQVVFDGGDADEGFTVATVTGLDGVDMRSASVDRPQAHGDFELPGFLAARIVTVSGKCFAESPERLGWYRRQLSGLLAGGGTGTVMFDWLGEKVSATGQRVGKPEFIDSVLPGRIADYVIQFRFPNPRLFGESHTFGPASSVSVHHYGNFTAAPVLTVSGSAAGYTIPGPNGKAFIVTQAITADSPHMIDMATGLLTVGGAVVTGGISRGDLWGVPAGSPLVMSVNNGLVLSATVRDTYI